MSGSGLDEVLEVVHASQRLEHMLSGKAVSRAVRGHMLMSTALYTIIIAQVLELDIPEDSTRNDYDVERKSNTKDVDTPEIDEGSGDLFQSLSNLLLKFLVVCQRPM